ncbi:TetR/AcrR family transcriptional regulator [Embleya scabrispora]|uniref:TetR/AcrR family transcriptional regulator n=1 Tax=Embleya scabrispora TaxID=159449 RepID=UPI00036213C5|nr:TetR/AcrR family transcriptional regulator [Embleya scabrispora]MYS80943.1 TetR family transcriptional regulator [Streptomyces sp. SID5474]
MARTKEFDPDAALQSALELFWERGYEATSMADLVARLGIARASIYATFGNKHDLYLAALDRYRESRNPELFEELSQPGPVLPAVRALVERFAREAAEEPSRLLGCFLTNTAAELAAHDAGAARIVEYGWSQMETNLTVALTRARAQGELGPDRDPQVLARFLLVLLQGMRVVGKAGPDSVRLRDATRQALVLLT